MEKKIGKYQNLQREMLNILEIITKLEVFLTLKFLINREKQIDRLIQSISKKEFIQLIAQKIKNYLLTIFLCFDQGK